MLNNKYYKEEKSFLVGPRARWKELRYTFGIMMQFIKGFRAMHFMGPCVTVFGSARFNETHPYYKLAQHVSSRIAQLGFAIMTGGGPGIMEAANRGAKDVGQLSIGCNITLDKEQHPNPYLDKYVNLEYFFVRKLLLRKYSSAFIVMPGGFGTLDELFGTITLIQTQKMAPFPIVVMGLEYHRDLISHLKNMVISGTISNDDYKIVLFTDSIDDAVNHIQQCAVFEVYSKIKPLWVLGEKA